MIEKELFEFIKSKYLPALEKSNGQYDSFDCMCRCKNLYIELKCRHTHYDELLIEKSKHARLIDEARQNQMLPIYINSTPKGVWAFNLDKVHITWKLKDNMPRTTEFENSERIIKEIGFISISKGKRL